MAIDLATQFREYVDEMFTAESVTNLVTNQDFDFTGANVVKVYKISTAPMNDYDRTGEKTAAGASRYGDVASLEATTEEFILKKDRSFTFGIDTLDRDETVMQLEAGKALARQEREVVIPEIDSYTYGVMAEKAGTKPAAVELTADNIYDEIIKATVVLDNAMVSETGRILLVTPEIYRLIKKSPEAVLDSDVGNELRLQGVISRLDGMSVVKVPSVRLPENFGFMVVHPSATVAPVKLKDFLIHENPPGLSGHLVEGRIVYDTLVLENKAKAIYYQAVTPVETV